ncbi:MAG: bifunctional (p)ppGpp synthetase/guanosine-3',5'-bis(diphosphate) 3'-pyrophosphohydrolase [Betaproteobacteria bacterium]|nr:bifunctional (p)ppGpp synthetase/guanosine-3',5'-bis(diphosphate) 3'-pyrophosphohydrolase [Betaproteobacteria bacterium]
MSAVSEISEFTRHLGLYLPPQDVALVESAYAFSDSAHRGQFRNSGDPYISHPLAVASILSQWRFDAEGLSAALLHDVMEDTPVTKSEIEDRFGAAVANLVDGVSKLDQLEFASRETAQAENFRKMLLAMAQDLRVILIKLADRLHNMRTLDAVSGDRKRRIATETVEIYAPIANRLGLNNVYQELQDLAFRFLHPMRYRTLGKAVKAARGNRREVVGKMLDTIRTSLRAAGITATVSGREKSLFSIYRKMTEKHLSFAQVLDIYGFRILVDDVDGCYRALGVLHRLYKPIPGKFKDYIAIPKANGYQSLHTKLIGPYGTPLEVQIRTQAMHRTAEAGVASHWLYKDANHHGIAQAQRETQGWLQSLLEIQTESGDSAEFLEHIKGDLFPDEVYVFTPKGKIMSLPRTATPIDFAYAVHTDVGHHCVAAKINHELAPLRTPLNNGDLVEIVTAPGARPNPAWLKFVATGKARSRIRHYLKNLQQKESAALGEKMLAQAAAALKIAIEDLTAPQWSALVKQCGAKSKSDLLADIGQGRRLAFAVAQALTAEGKGASRGKTGPLSLRGIEGVAVQYAKCCHPIPGDRIVGVLRRGQSLQVHIADCPVARKATGEHEQILDVEWSRDVTGDFPVNVRAFVSDQRGALAHVALEIAEAGANIANVSLERAEGERAVNMVFTLEVQERDHLARVMRALRRVPEVLRIQRVRP